ERALDRRNRPAADLDAGIAPRAGPAGRIADPVLADAEARDERDVPVDREHLAVVPRQPSERALEPRRVVAAHVHPGVPEALPEPTRRLPEVAHPVVDQPDGDAFLRLRDQRVRELRADLVLAEEIALEIDMLPGPRDLPQPRRVVLACVAEQLD